MGSGKFSPDQQAPDSWLVLEQGSARHKQWLGTLVQPLYCVSRWRVMRQTPEASLAHVEDLGQSDLPSFSVSSSALAQLCAPNLSLLSPAVTIRTWWTFSHPVSFLAQLNSLFLLDQHPPQSPCLLGERGSATLDLEVVTICHCVLICPLCALVQVCCAGEFQKGMEESEALVV